MKKHLLKSLLALALVLISGNVWGEEKTDVLNRALTGVTSSSYAAWSGKTSNSAAVYAGQSAGGNSSIQLRTTNSNSGIVSTASGGKIKKIVVSWNKNTADTRVLNVYGSSTAYTDASDLYNTSKQGTLIGTLEYQTSSAQTIINVSGDYSYIGIRSASGALYLDEIKITWEKSTDAVTTTTIDDTGITNTDVYSSTAAGSLSATVTDGNADEITGATVTWSGNNDAVATIAADGTVTLVAAGNVTFTATYEGVSGTYQSSYDTFELTVTDSTPSVSFGTKTKTILVGGNYTQTATVVNSTATPTYSSSATGVATVDASTGKVTGVAGGEATITATINVGDKNYSDSYVITVFAPEDNKFNFTVGYAYGSGLTPSSDQKVASTPYVFTSGSVTITTAGTGKFLWNEDFRLYTNSSAVIEVPDGKVITKIVFSGATMTQGTIEGTAFSDNINNTWTGRKKSITIARDNGTLTIKTMEVTVETATAEVATAGIVTDKLVKTGDGTPNTTTITTDPAGLVVSYSSSNTSVATVSDAGVVSAVAGGTATITATWAAQAVGGTNYEAGTESFDVTVYAVEDGVFDFTTLLLKYGTSLTPDNKSGQEDYITATSTWTAGDITMAVAGKYRWWSTDGTLRLFESSTITLTAPTGSIITKIVLTGNSSKLKATVASGNYSSSGTTGTWTGASNSVVFTREGDFQAKTITVTYTDQTSTTVTVSSYEYATASFDSPVVVPAATEATVYAVTGVTTDGEVQLGALAAGTVLGPQKGVIVYKAGGGNVTFSYSNDTPASVTTKLYTYGTIKTTDYILSVNENDKFGFCHPTAQMDAPAGKAFLPASAVPSSAPFLRIGGTTRIANAEAEAETGEYYDLTGRKVEQPQRGIYIVGGKKVMVK